MKIAALKLGARITRGGTSGGSGEALALLEMLSKGNEVHAYTKVLGKDENIEFVQTHQILDEYADVNEQNYDCLVVINGSVNYFGGIDSPDQTLNYNIINNFKGRVYYIMCDPSLPLTQVWKSIEKKSWAENYRREDIEITRTDITYICQPKNIVKIAEDIKKHGIHIDEVIHYPFEKFPLLFKKPEWKKLSERNYDILYGGTFRGGKRQEDMIKYYFGYSDLNVTMFGKIKDADFNPKKVNSLSHPNYEGAVNYDLFNEKMSNSISTVIIGDKYYKEIDDLAQRIYESILSGVITFIDSDYDRTKRVYTDDLADLLYVSSREEIINKIEKIKQLSEEQFLSLLENQYNSIKIDIDQYCLDFSNLLKG